MGILISLALGTLGFLTSIIYFSTVMLPLIYGLPKSLYLSLRGEMRWMAPLHYLLAALGWLIGWAVIFFAIFQILYAKGIIVGGVFSSNAQSFLLFNRRISNNFFSIKI